MLARVKDFDGDDDKLFAEYQQDIESDQLGEFRQELKDCVANSLRERPHKNISTEIFAPCGLLPS